MREEHMRAVHKWGTELGVAVAKLCAEAENAFAAVGVAHRRAAAAREAIEHEARALRKVAAGLRLGALAKVWNRQISSIVDEERDAYLERIDTAATRERRRPGASVSACPLTPFATSASIQNEPLIVRYGERARTLHALAALRRIRDTFVRNAAAVAHT
jgi:hypothetical protein